MFVDILNAQQQPNNDAYSRRATMPAFNKLTEAEDERLALLLEECAESIKIVGKILRHGFENLHPVRLLTNRELLRNELGDIFFAVRLMCDAGDLDIREIEAAATSKKERAKQYLHHQ